MHFDGTLGGFFKTPVLKDKITGEGIEINKELSALDIEKLNAMYPCTSVKLSCGKFEL